MADDITWYSVYQNSLMADGMHDADYEGWDTKEIAMEHAKGYLTFAKDAEAEVFVVPIPSAWWRDHDEDAVGDLWSLWDNIHKVDDADFVWLKRPDIVGQLRFLADDQDDDLARLLNQAADEIARLKLLVVTNNIDTVKRLKALITTTQEGLANV